MSDLPLPPPVPGALEGVGHLPLPSLPLQEVKSTTVAFLLLRIPTLKIKMASKKEVFEANLKTECDLWYLMVKEMCAGKKLADDHKVWARGCLCSEPGCRWFTCARGNARPSEPSALGAQVELDEVWPGRTEGAVVCETPERPVGRHSVPPSPLVTPRAWREGAGLSRLAVLLSAARGLWVWTGCTKPSRTVRCTCRISVPQ